MIIYHRLMLKFKILKYVIAVRLLFENILLDITFSKNIVHKLIQRMVLDHRFIDYIHYYCSSMYIIL